MSEPFYRRVQQPSGVVTFELVEDELFSADEGRELLRLLDAAKAAGFDSSQDATPLPGLPGTGAFPLLAVRLADFGQNGASAVAVDDDWVYMANNNHASKIYRFPKTNPPGYVGTPFELLVDHEVNVIQNRLILDGPDIWWAHIEGDFTTYKLWKAAKADGSGAAPVVTATVSPNDFAIGQKAYWIESDDSTIWAASKTNGSGAGSLIDPSDVGSTLPIALAADSQRVYWNDGTSIFSASGADGSDARLLIDGSGLNIGLGTDNLGFVVDDQALIWIRIAQTDGNIWTANKSDGSNAQMMLAVDGVGPLNATGQVPVAGLGLDDELVYVVGSSGPIYTMPKRPGFVVIGQTSV